MKNFNDLESQGLSVLSASETNKIEGGSDSDLPSPYQIAYAIGKTFKATLSTTLSMGGIW